MSRTYKKNSMLFCGFCDERPVKRHKMMKKFTGVSGMTCNEVIDFSEDMDSISPSPSFYRRYEGQRYSEVRNVLNIRVHNKRKARKPSVTPFERERVAECYFHPHQYFIKN